MYRTYIPCALLALALFAGPSAFAQSGGDFALIRSSVNPGTTSPSTGGDFALRSTSGEAGVGFSTGSDFTLETGFLTALAAQVEGEGEGEPEGLGEGTGEGIGEGQSEGIGEGAGEGQGEGIGEGMGEGGGEEAILTASPLVGDFGDVEIGGMRALEFRVANDGGLNGNVTANLADGSVFSITTADTFSVPANLNTILIALFQPTEAGVFTDVLTLSDGIGFSAQVMLVGEAFAEIGDIEGLVTDTDGVPLECAVVLIDLGGDESLRVAANMDGEFVVNDLPAGVYPATAFSPNFAPETIDIAVEGGVTTDVAFMLEAADAASISGIVIDLDTGAPLGGVLVELIDANNNVVAFTVTCSDGRFTIPLPTTKAPFRVEFTATNFDIEAVDFDTDDTTEVNAALTLLLPDEMLGSLQGTVTDAKTGVAIASAQVIANDGAVGRPSTTSATGDYSLSRMPEGQYDITVSAQGFAGSAQPTSIFAGNQPTEMNFALQSLGEEGTGEGQAEGDGEGSGDGGGCPGSAYVLPSTPSAPNAGTLVLYGFVALLLLQVGRNGETHRRIKSQTTR